VTNVEILGTGYNWQNIKGKLQVYYPIAKRLIHSSFITPTGSHIQIYSEVQLYNKLYTIGLHTDKHIMQEHIKGPYSEILQQKKHKKTIPHKKRNLKNIRKTITRFSVQNRTTQHL